nr:MAG TPA: hypothetical protein [Caudoviricetes sp.]
MKSREGFGLPFFVRKNPQKILYFCLTFAIAKDIL